jgi:hypothetical protein
MIAREKERSTRRKTCPSASLSAMYLTRPGPGSNIGLRDQKPATDYLRGTVAVRLKRKAEALFYPMTSDLRKSSVFVRFPSPDKSNTLTEVSVGHR